MIDIQVPFQSFRPWFRALSRPVQWLVGLPISFIGVSGFLSSVPAPGEPDQAIFITLLVTIALTVLAELLRPKPDIENARPAGLGDFQFPTTTEARVEPLVWGRVRQKGANVIWYGDLFQEAITERVKTGLWSSTRVTTGFRYNVGIQFAICRGPNVVLKRVWIGDEVVFTGTISTENNFDIDKPDLFGGADLGNGGIEATCDFTTGSLTQAVNAYLNTDARQRVAGAITPTAPRYIGTSYVLAREFTSNVPSANDKGAYIGNSTAIKVWSFEVERFPGIFSGQSAGEDKIGTTDVNPINAIYELLTNSEWGFGFPDGDIDVGPGSSFLSAADTMITEANGFAFLLDREMKAKELLQEFQRQIDGVVFLSQSTGKWTVKLARADYDIDLVEQLTDANVAEVRDYTRGAWEDTTNTITVQYDKRDDDYKTSFALAQDMANALIQGDGTIPGAQSVVGKVAYPGVKDSALAANLAWRDLRGQSYPLSRCTLIVNRQMWQLSIGDVVAWTNVKLGFTKLPMRITRIDYGRLQSNRMTLTVVQDIFQFAVAAMGTPAATAWVPPTVSLVAYPSDEQHAEECPRAILVRDPAFSGDDTVSKVFCAARNQSGEVAFEIGQRNDSGAPAGAFSNAGDVVAFIKIGNLDAALPAGSAIPDASILINASPDSQTALEAAFDDAATLSDMGVDLAQLILVGTEFMLVQSAADSGPDVDLQDVYRGVLDSVQQDHAINTDVFLVHLGAGITDTIFPDTNNVDIELRSRSNSQTFAGSVTVIGLTMAKRALRPYAPAAVLYNGDAGVYGVPDLEDNGSGENGQQFATDWRRRRYNNTDELAALLSDDAAVLASTEYQVSVFVDPSGGNTEIASSPFAWQTGSGTVQVPRNEILELAAAGTEIRVLIQARHDLLSETDITSRQTLTHDVVPTGVNDGLFYLGGNLSATTATNSYATVDPGVFTVRIGAAYSTSDVEHRINGGSWTAIITAGGTSGVTASLSASDTIELRHTVNETPDPQFVEIENPSAARVAYGTFSA